MYSLTCYYYGYEGFPYDKKIKFAALALVLVILISSLAGCAHKKKTAYQTYIQNLLDVNYKGNFEDYIKENAAERKPMPSVCTVNVSHTLRTS